MGFTGKVQFLKVLRMLKFYALLSLVCAAASAAQQYQVAFPQIAYGGGWETKIIIANISSTPQQITLDYFDANGNPLSIPFGGTPASQTKLTIPPNGQQEVVPDYQGDTTTVGWAGLTYNEQSLRIQGVFLWQNQGNSTQAVAPIVSLSTPACLIPLPANALITMPYDQTAGGLSAYAFANTISAPVTMTLKFYDQLGNLIGTDIEQIPSLGHVQFAVTDKVPALANTKGTMQINGAGIVPLGFKFYGSIFTTWLP